MRLKISLENFKKIRNVASISSSWTNIKSSNDNILLICQDYTLTVYGSDGFMNIMLTLPESSDLKIIEEGKIFINSKTIMSLIDHLKKDEIEIYKIENNIFQLNCGSFACELSTTSEQKFLVEDFKTDDYKKINLSHQKLKEINNRFREFVKQPTQDNNNTHIGNAIMGINLRAENKELNICSTDAFCVVYAKFEYEGEDFEINILPSTLQKILSLIKNDSEKISLFVKDESLIFKTNEFSIKARLIDSKYPSFLQWFDTTTYFKILVHKYELIDALERSLLISEEKPKQVIINIENNEMIIESKGGQKGSSKETLQIEILEGNNFTIAFDSLKLKNLLKNIEDTKIYMAFVSATKPVIIKAESNEHNYQQIILPTRSY